MHNGNWNNMDGGGWWWMMILMAFFWGGLILLAVAFVRRPQPQVHAGGAGPIASAAGRPSAQEILAERLARGEIEADEYRSRLDTLNHRPDA